VHALLSDVSARAEPRLLLNVIRKGSAAHACLVGLVVNVMVCAWVGMNGVQHGAQLNMA